MRGALELRRDRWEGWVGFAWALAGLTALGSVILIATLGQMEVPVVDRFGNRSFETQLNPMVWATAIGQSIAAIMLAALFSMINSIYQNSCDQLAGKHELKKTEYPGNAGQAASNSADAQFGIRVTRVRESSPVYGKLSVGSLIVAINGKPVNTVEQAEASLVDGDNHFSMYNPDGEDISQEFHFPVARMRIEADKESLPEALRVDSAKNGGDRKGLEVKSLNNDSPLGGVIRPGFVILSVNGVPINKVSELDHEIVDGDNVLEYINAKGEKIIRTMKVPWGESLIKGDPISI